MAATVSLTLRNRTKSKIRAVEMRFSKEIVNKTTRDIVRNNSSRSQLNIIPIDQRLGWFGHVLKMQHGRTANRVHETKRAGNGGICRSRRTWEDEIMNRIGKEKQTGNN